MYWIIRVEPSGGSPTLCHVNSYQSTGLDELGRPVRPHMWMVGGSNQLGLEHCVRNQFCLLNADDAQQKVVLAVL